MFQSAFKYMSKDFEGRWFEVETAVSVCIDCSVLFGMGEELCFCGFNLIDCAVF